MLTVTRLDELFLSALLEHLLLLVAMYRSKSYIVAAQSVHQVAVSALSMYVKLLLIIIHIRVRAYGQAGAHQVHSRCAKL